MNQSDIIKKNKLKVYLTNFVANSTDLLSSIGRKFVQAIPYILVIMLIIVASEYIRIKMNSNEEDSTLNINDKNDNKLHKTKFLFCSDIKDTQCLHTKLLMRELIDYLRLRAGKIDCSPPKITFSDSVEKSNEENLNEIIFREKSIHKNQIMDYLSSKKPNLLPRKDETRERAFSSIIKAIDLNPHWQLRVLDKNYTDLQFEFEDDNQPETIYIMSTTSSKSMSCRIRELLKIIYLRALMIVGTCCVGFVGYLVFILINKRNAKKNKEFFSLVAQVVDMLEKQYELHLINPDKIKPYIARSHIYDTIFDPSQRLAKKKTWEKLIKFIDEMESRVALETQFIEGEETLVWKWISPKHTTIQQLKTTETVSTFLQSSNDSNSLRSHINSTFMPSSSTTEYEHASQSNNNNNKSNWLGKSINLDDNVIYDYAPCLKVRHMFTSDEVEKNPLFHIEIHNDIIDKCNSSSDNKLSPFSAPLSNSILHIGVDKKSKDGCVYIKCINNLEACKIYKLLTGCWYKKNLTHVKFLKLDRYHERYPESINSTKPICKIAI
jgi:hypothetical protein